MTQPISGASVQPAPVQTANPGRDADGDNDGSKAGAYQPGPAVAMSLSNVAKSGMSQDDCGW